MSLSVYLSNDIEKLAQKLNENIYSHNENIFNTEYIVVQTEGLRRWLGISMAESSGIFTNFKFISPNELVNELIRSAFLKSSDIYDTENLRWIIYFILDDPQFEELFPHISNYYKSDTLKRLQIATTLADLYDQYSFYRQDYIVKWNKNEYALSGTDLEFHEKWQFWIWNKIKEQQGFKGNDKVSVREELLDKLEHDQEFITHLKSKFIRISLFGFSSFTQFHIDIFLKLVNITSNLDFYMFNPAPEVFWLQDISEKSKVRIEKLFRKNPQHLGLNVGNQLLMNYGKMAQYFYLMLFEYDDFINAIDNESLLSVPERTTLLNRIKYDIYNNIPYEIRDKIPAELIKDGSVSVASCYTILREVESLYNYVLQLFEIEMYEPKDIIVMVSDIDLYTPYIQAVFDNAPYNVPFSIADRSFRGKDNIIGILNQILSLSYEDLSSEDVIQLLEFEPIRQKYGINNIAMIRTIIDQALIRTGVTGNQSDETFLVSWNYGMEKILLGYAIKTSEMIYSAGHNFPIIPLDLIEGEYAEQAFRLKVFVDDLTEMLLERNTPRTLADWKMHIRSVTEKMFYPDESNSEVMTNIRSKFDPENHEIHSIRDKKIKYEVFFNGFFDSLYLNTRKGNFITGSLTFCSMVPMRSIPFKVVALLGLNKNIFPRKSRDISFNLIGAEKRKGDRDLRISDKYLFLESMLSAQEKIYLSYIGQDVKTKTEIPPSPVIDELLDYIAESSDINVRNEILVRHPLHVYNKKYFEGGKLYSYLDFQTETSTTDYFINEKISPPNGHKTIDIKYLITFFTKPLETYFNRTLKIRYEDKKLLLDDSEVFLPDKLQDYYIRNKILNIDDPQEIREFIIKEKIKGNLPLKNMSEVVVNIIYDKIEKFKAKKDFLLKGKKEEKFRITNQNYNGIALEGEIGNIYGDSFVMINLGKSYTKKLIELQLNRLVLSLLRPDIKNYNLITQDDKTENIISMSGPALDVTSAQDGLDTLIREYFKYEDQLFPVFPFADMKVLKNLKTPEGSLEKENIEKYLSNLESKLEFRDYDIYLKKFFAVDLDFLAIERLQNDGVSINKVLNIILPELNKETE